MTEATTSALSPLVATGHVWPLSSPTVAGAHADPRATRVYICSVLCWGCHREPQNITAGGLYRLQAWGTPQADTGYVVAVQVGFSKGSPTTKVTEVSGSGTP